MISEPASIAVFVKAKADGARCIGLETGPTTTWLWHELWALGLPVICIDARHAKAALSLQINKSDRNDAVGLNRMMQAGWYKEIQGKSWQKDGKEVSDAKELQTVIAAKQDEFHRVWALLLLRYGIIRADPG